MKKTCQGHDSRVYNTRDRKDGYNYPPLHPNCRSITRPYFGEEAEQFLVRKARNPITGQNEIIDNMSYKEWLQKQREKYGNDAVDNSFKMVKNKASDLKQYERYENILNTDDTKTFEKFQELKYNNTDKWEKLKIAYSTKKGIYSEGQANMFINLVKDKLDTGKQDKHILGTDNYVEGKSYLTITKDRVQELVNKYATTGKKKFTDEGKWTKTELITIDEIIGVYINKNYNTSCKTNSFTIRYSKNGYHIVPANYVKKE